MIFIDLFLSCLDGTECAHEKKEHRETCVLPSSCGVRDELVYGFGCIDTTRYGR
jgi:hypothetical protein